MVYVAVRKIFLGACNALRVSTLHIIVYLAREQRSDFGLFGEGVEDKSHTNVHSVVRLAEVRGARIIVHRDLDFVDAGQRVHNYHIAFCVLHFRLCKTVNVALFKVLFLAVKAFALYPRHIEHIKTFYRFVYRVHFGELRAAPFEHVLDVARQSKRGCGDKHEFVVREAGECLYKRVYRAPVFQIAAKSHGKVVQPPKLAFESKKIGKGLRGVEVSAVACVYNVAVRA